MFRIIFALLFVFLFSSAFSQEEEVSSNDSKWRLGIKSMVIFENEVYDYYYNDKLYFLNGISAEYRKTEKISYRIALMFAYKTEFNSYRYYSVNTSEYTFALPIGMKYFLMKKKTLTPYVSGGITVLYYGRKDQLLGSWYNSIDRENYTFCFIDYAPGLQFRLSKSISASLESNFMMLLFDNDGSRNRLYGLPAFTLNVNCKL